MCVLCVCDMYIQWCRHTPGHTHIHIRIQMPMYVEAPGSFTLRDGQSTTFLFGHFQGERHWELLPRLDEFIFFLVSQFLLQVLSRSFAPLPPSLEFSSFFPHPGRRIFPSLPGFTTHARFLKRCAQCCWVNILSTNPFCGLLHSHRQLQGISRFPRHSLRLASCS